MSPYPSGGDSRKWATLASMVVMIGLAAVLWWVFYGFGGSGETSETGKSEDAGFYRTARAMQDPNVAALAQQVAWYFAQHERLPKDLDELRAAPRPPEWPPAPAATAYGEPIAYAATGERTFTLTLAPRTDAAEGAARPVVIVETIPADLPRSMQPAAFAAWWQLEQQKMMLGKVKKGLESLRR
jgi:hypothetical protein